MKAQGAHIAIMREEENQVFGEIFNTAPASHIYIALIQFTVCKPAQVWTILF